MPRFCYEQSLFATAHAPGDGSQQWQSMDTWRVWGSQRAPAKVLANPLERPVMRGPPAPQSLSFGVRPNQAGGPKPQKSTYARSPPEQSPGGILIVLDTPCSGVVTGSGSVPT